jgi:hypothetical protein
MCAKTGTAENKRVIEGHVLKLKDHSVFVCFAPRENPKIAVAVIIENGGYGGAQAAPIASLLVEKYLNDTVSTARLALEDDITVRNLMPKYLVRLQFRDDSNRAAIWAKQSGDSTRWLKYQTPSFRYMMLDTLEGSKSPLLLNLRKTSPYKSALAERMARLRAQALASAAGKDSTQKTATTPDSAVHRRPAGPPDSTKKLPPAPRPRKDTSAKPDTGTPSASGIDPIQKDSTH